MRSITAHLTEPLKAHAGRLGPLKAEPFPVKNYRELMEHVAQLAYLNKDYLLFFRGQGYDYRSKAGASTIYPAIYRGERVTAAQLELKFDALNSSAKYLCDALKTHRVKSFNDVRKRRLIQWSILQHYEVCPTPLLDITHSLRVACSFAALSEESREAYIFVLGLPFITNRISINSEHDIALIRLLSICPPEALRPYFQDGYLAGTDETTTDFESKDELDFRRRLIAKFSFNPNGDFWSKGFDRLPESALYPRNDRIKEICGELRQELGTEVAPGRLGQFLQEWTDVETRIMSAARNRYTGSRGIYNLSEAIAYLARGEILPAQLADTINRLRRLRNDLVHTSRKTSGEEVLRGTQELSQIRKSLRQRDI